MSPWWSILSFEYPDMPEGENIFGKWCNAIKPATHMWMFLSSADVILYSKPTTYLGTVRRFGYLGLPIIGGTTVFVLVSNLLCKARQQDDWRNWAAAGAATGLFIGAIRPSAELAVFSSALFALIGGMVRDAKLNGVRVLGNKAHLAKRYYPVDRTYLPDRVGEWRKKFERPQE